MTRLKKYKIISVILAIVMIISAIPVYSFGVVAEEVNENTYVYSVIGCNATIASVYENGSTWCYPDPENNGTEFISIETSLLPKKLTITDVYVDEWNVVWYKVEAVEGYSWPTGTATTVGDVEYRYEDCHYIKAYMLDVEYSDNSTVSCGIGESEVIITTEDMENNFTNILFGALDVTSTKGTTVKNSIVDYSAMDCHSVGLKGIDFQLLFPENAYSSTKWQPTNGKPVTVTVTNVWDITLENPIVDVYHILDTADAITAAQENGTLLTSTDADLLAAYPEEATIAKEALSLESEMVSYVLLTTRNDSVLLNEDGSVSFETDSFSEFWIVSGATNDTTSITNGTHTIYIAPGASGTLTVNDSDVTLSTTTPVEGVTVGTTEGDYSTSVSFFAADTAVIGSEGTFTLTWRANSQNRTATVTIKVVDQDEYEKQEYLSNSIQHIQIDIEASAVILGYNNDASTAVDLNFTSSTDYTLTRVPDEDSEVGYYYQLVYDGVTITVRIDETQEYPIEPTTFEITGISIEDGQISFNGTFPVGTKDNPVKYSITVETTLSLTPNDETTAENVDVTLSDTIGYWDSDNECPGLDRQQTNWQNGSVISGSGIDLSKFQTGAVLGENTVYIVFSNLTKIVEGYTFSSGETASRNFVFTLYRRAKNSTDEWVAFDTITVTANSATTNTTINAEASKYDVENIANYEFKIVETGNSISGYTCTDEIKINGATSTDNIFTWTKTEDTTNKTITYSVQITCTNTYAKVVSGLTVNKVVNKENAADTLPIDDSFEIVITPTTLTIEEAISVFNDGSYNYTVDGGASQTVTPVGGTDATFGSLKVSIKAGQSINFSNLPVGSYSVKETTGSNTNYIYDTTVHTVTLEEGKEVKVTFTNTYKQQQTSLTIIKSGADASDTNQTFLFHVVGEGIDLTATVHGNGSVTIAGLKVGDTYTITEITDWSWRYKYSSVTTELTNTTAVTNGIQAELSATAADNVLTFNNTREKTQWLDGDSYCVNEFTGSNVTE